MYICIVYKEFPRYNLSIKIKDYKFWRFKTLLCNYHSSKPWHIPSAPTNNSEGYYRSHAKLQLYIIIGKLTTL